MAFQVYREYKGELQKVGVLDTVSDAGERFTYAEGYLAMGDAGALSLHLARLEEREPSASM